MQLEEGATVYKMIGPVLIKQDQEEAKQTVQKRIDYISEQLWVVMWYYVIVCRQHTAFHLSNIVILYVSKSV